MEGPPRVHRAYAVEPALQGLLDHIISSEHTTSLISDYTRQHDMGLAYERKAELALHNLTHAPPTQKPSKSNARTAIFQQQVHLLEEKQKSEMILLDDLQEMMKARARLEQEHAEKLAKLSQHFLTKRKFPVRTFAEDQDNILLVDLYRYMLDSFGTQATERSAAADKLFALANEQFELRKDEYRQLSRHLVRIVTALQDELYRLDAAVQQGKKQYDSAMKETHKGTMSRKKRAPTEADEKRLQMAHHEYLLELAAANRHYLKFRNEQLPEVLDNVSRSSMGFVTFMVSSMSSLLSVAPRLEMEEAERYVHLSGLLSPEFERRSFIHDNRSEFPGRQLFDMEPYGDADEARELSIAGSSKRILLEIRKLLEHHGETLLAQLKEKCAQMASMENLFHHAAVVEGMLDKTKPETINEKIEVLFADIESTSARVSQIDAKIACITNTGIDAQGGPSPSTSIVHISTIDLSEAQAREDVRRSQLHHESPLTHSAAAATPSPAAAAAHDGLSPADSPVATRERTEKASRPVSIVSIFRRKKKDKSEKDPDSAQKAKDSPTASTSSLPVPPPPPPMPTSSFSPPPPPPPPPVFGSPAAAATAAAATAAAAMSPYANGHAQDEEVPKQHQVLYDFAPTQHDDLPLTKGDIIHCLIVRDDGWNQGINRRGQVGFYPQGYAQYLPDQNSPFDKARLVRVANGGLRGVTLGGGSPTDVVKVVGGSEWAAAGLRESDVVLEVNGEPCADMDAPAVSRMIELAGPGVRVCVLQVSPAQRTNGLA